MRPYRENPYQASDVAIPDYDGGSSKKMSSDTCALVEKIGIAFIAYSSFFLGYHVMTNLEKPETVLATAPYQPIVDAVPTTHIAPPKTVEIPKPKHYDYYFEITFSDPRSRNGEEQRIKIPIHSEVPLSAEELDTIIRKKIDERINPPMA